MHVFPHPLSLLVTIAIPAVPSAAAIHPFISASVSSSASCQGSRPTPLRHQPGALPALTAARQGRGSGRRGRPARYPRCAPPRSPGLLSRVGLHDAVSRAPRQRDDNHCRNGEPDHERSVHVRPPSMDGFRMGLSPPVASPGGAGNTPPKDAILCLTGTPR